MTLDEIITDVRRVLNRPSTGGDLSDSEIAAFVNRGQELLIAKVTESDQNFFEESDQTLGFITDQEEYDLPAALWNRKITRVTRTDLTKPKQLDRIRFQEKDRHHSATVFLAGSGTDGEVYYIRGNRIGLKPTPKSTIAANLLIHYVALPHELHWAEAGSVTGTTFIMPTATTGVSPLMKGGRVSTAPNYYIGARIRILGGTDRGLERKITAFTVATRTATVDSSWTAATILHQQYVILSQIPDEYHEALLHYAMMTAAAKVGDTARYEIARSGFKTIFDSLVNTIEPRTFDENQHVRPAVDAQFD